MVALVSVLPELDISNMLPCLKGPTICWVKSSLHGWRKYLKVDVRYHLGSPPPDIKNKAFNYS